MEIRIVDEALAVIQRVITTHLIRQAKLPRNEARTGAVTLIQRFGSAANLNIHLHGLWLDGVYQRTGGEAGEGEPVFHETAPPTAAQLQTLLDKIIQRILKMLTQTGHLIEEAGMVYLANTDPDNVLAPLQTACVTWRIAIAGSADVSSAICLPHHGCFLRARRPRSQRYSTMKPASLMTPDFKACSRRTRN